MILKQACMSSFLISWLTKPTVQSNLAFTAVIAAVLLMSFGSRRLYYWNHVRKLSQSNTVMAKMKRLRHKEFLDFVCHCFRSNGFEAVIVERTRVNGDELLLKKNGSTYSARVFHGSKPIGTRAVRRALESKRRNSANQAMVVGPTVLTSRATKMAVAHDVQRFDIHRLNLLASGRMNSKPTPKPNSKRHSA